MVLIDGTWSGDTMWIGRGDVAGGDGSSTSTTQVRRSPRVLANYCRLVFRSSPLDLHETARLASRTFRLCAMAVDAARRPRAWKRQALTTASGLMSKRSTSGVGRSPRKSSGPSGNRSRPDSPRSFRIFQIPSFVRARRTTSK